MVEIMRKKLVLRRENEDIIDTFHYDSHHSAMIFSTPGSRFYRTIIFDACGFGWDGLGLSIEESYRVARSQITERRSSATQMSYDISAKN